MNDGELIDRLPLTPEQRTRFKQLLFEKQMTAMDAHTVAIVQGQPSDSSITRKAVELSAASFDREVRALASAASFVEDRKRNPQHALASKDSLGPIATTQILDRIPGILTPTQAEAFAAYRAEKNAARGASQKLVRCE